MEEGKKCMHDLFFLIIYSKQMTDVQILIYIPMLNRLSILFDFIIV